MSEDFGEHDNQWSASALLHDFDYEMQPDAPVHPMKGEPILAARGGNDEIRRAISAIRNRSGSLCRPSSQSARSPFPRDPPTDLRKPR